MESEENYEKIKNEQHLEWWRPSREDGYSLEKKLFRSGCRGAKRKYLECTRNEEIDFKICLVGFFLKKILICYFFIEFPEGIGKMPTIINFFIPNQR